MPPRCWHDLWRLGLLGAAFFFALLTTRPLSTPDEGRYTEIPREMVATGDWVTPRLDGVKYFEKPPLMYWLTASAIEVFGPGELAARLWCALLALAGVLLTYAAGRTLFDRETGLAAAAVLATSLLYYGLSRLLTLDLAVAVWISAALFAFVVAVRTPAGWRRRWLFWSFYAAMALATLTKGLIGIALPGAVVAAWLLLFWRWRDLRPFYPFSGTLLLLAIAAPWHLLAARANPDFLYFYFVHEHYLRFTTRLHGRYEPWWFFGPVVLGGLFPWSVFLFQAVRSSLAGPRSWRLRRSSTEVAWFLLVWIGFILLFFSRSQSKLVPYILPVFPALALLIARYLVTALATPPASGLRRGLLVFAGLATLLGVAVLLPHLDRDPTMAADLRPWQLVLAATFLTGGVAVGWLTLRRGSRAALFALGGWTVALLLVLNPVMGAVDRRSSKPLALDLRARLEPGDEVFSAGEYLQDVPVYLGRTIGVAGFEGELAFGIAAEPERSAGRFLSIEELVARWQAPGRRYAIGRERKLASLLQRPDFPHVVLGRHRGQILLTNREP